MSIKQRSQWRFWILPGTSVQLATTRRIYYLFPDLYDLKRGGIGFRPRVGLLRCWGHRIILFGANQEGMMGLRVKRNCTRAVNRFHISDRSDFVVCIGMADLGYAGFSLSAITTWSK